MCVCNGSDIDHCTWHRRILHLYDLASGLTESQLFTPPEVLASLEDVEMRGEWPA